MDAKFYWTSSFFGIINRFLDINDFRIDRKREKGATDFSEVENYPKWNCPE